MSRRTLVILGRTHGVEVLRPRREPSGAPRLALVAYQPNATARALTETAVASLRRHTPEPHELWIIDNASPPEHSAWLRGEADVNVVFNRTPPAPRRSLADRLRRRPALYAGSHANAVALEIAARVIDPDTQLLMTLHMDIMACRPGWLTHLRRHLTGPVRGVGVRLDTARVRTLHVLGMMFDFTLFRPLRMTFAHDMPRHDVGDGISLALQAAGHELWATPNTLHDPSLVERLPPDSPHRHLHVDRSLDDDGQVIFMHLGRGIVKSEGACFEQRTTPGEWLRFAREVVLA